jgi:L-2-hydroxyglutarate oxidase LhgO
MTEKVGAVVVGAGVVGLACARALALRGIETIVLEAHDAIGTGTSSRNSEVIHAGLYYPPGSLKARLCVEGNRRLYEYCARHGVAHRRCGKLIVATAPEQEEKLAALKSQPCGQRRGRPAAAQRRRGARAGTAAAGPRRSSRPPPASSTATA